MLIRDIKFRAWDENTLKMYYSYFDSDINDDSREYHPISFAIGYKGRKNIILLQFTGLTDSNGKDIYEGDIIEYTQHHFNTDMVKIKRKIVKWNYDRWNIYQTNAGESNIKVIGDIYERPEILTII